MLWHIWLLNAYIDFILIFHLGQPCTLFILTYFCSFNLQLSTNKVVVIVVVAVAVFLPLVQK